MNRSLPTIVHLDADAFFVACEQARDPSLVGKRCAVGGTERGIISSASYEARACGVYTPMPTTRARRVCPDLILIPHTPGLYGTVSRRMFDLCEGLTPWVQRNSIDEGYLDLAPCGLRDRAAVEAAVRGLQERIRTELSISVSFGLASNKLVSQIASKLRLSCAAGGGQVARDRSENGGGARVARRPTHPRSPCPVAERTPRAFRRGLAGDGGGGARGGRSARRDRTG
jgi:nucleotidyltransferase/DNA polymerase involved in DNA repair